MAQPRAPVAGAAAGAAQGQDQGGWERTLKSGLRSVAMFFAIQMGEFQSWRFWKGKADHA
jgi:hypothetical protein